MYCSQCHADNLDDAAKCLSCGAAIPQDSQQVESHLETNGRSEAQSSDEDATKAELIAQAEILAQKVREKRALAARTQATASSPPKAPLDNELTRRSKVADVESVMNVVIGLIFVTVIIVSGLMSYLNMPEHTKIGASLANSQKTPIAIANAAPSEHRPAPDHHPVSLAQEGTIDTSPSTLPVATPQKAEPIKKPEVSAKEKVEPIASDSLSAPVLVTKKVIDQTSPAAKDRRELALVAGEEVTAPVDEFKTERAMKVAVEDKSIVSNVTRKREVTGCNLDGSSNTVCATKYVVTFKRFWGPMLEERVYPSREMSIRAQELWSRESKILEPDGSINEAYVVKPKTFAPIPGFPIS